MMRRLGWAVVGLVLVLASGEALGLEVGSTKLQLQPWATGRVSVATDGELSLAVWRDRRSGGVFGTRVRKDGTVLDPAGLLLNPKGLVASGAAAVGYDGTNFLVVWFAETRVLGTRVSRDGKVLDPDGILITYADSSGEPAIGCDGAGRCIVVVLDVGEDDGNYLTVGRVEGNNSNPDKSFHLTFGEVGQPRVAWTGSNFLVVWDEERGDSHDVLGSRILPGGTVLDEGGFVISAASGHQRHPDVGRAGDLLWVVWEDTRRGASDIFGARVRGDGTVLDPNGIALSTASGDQLEPRVADEGVRSFVLWTDVRGEKHNRIRGARVNHDGTVINVAGFPVSSTTFAREEHPAIACIPGQCLAVYEAPLTFPPYNDVSVGNFVLGTRLTMRNGALDSPALELSKAAPEQQSPAVAWGNDNYLLVWQEFRDVAGPTIMAARVGRDGTVLDPDGIRLPSAPGSSAPAVGFDGGEFLVVWQEPQPSGEDIRGARVSPTGQLLDSTSLAISTAPVRQLAPTVAGGDGLFFVAWEDSRDSALYDLRFTLFGARVSGSGQVLDAGGLLLAAAGHPGNGPDVVHLDDSFLVAWNSDGIEGTRVAYDGTVLDPAGLALSPHTDDYEGTPSLSYDGKTALVVWDRYGDILATRVTRDGTIAGTPGFTLSHATEPGTQGFPDVASDGVNHRAVWLDVRPPTSPLNPFSVYGTRVAHDGTVLDPGGKSLLEEVFIGYPSLSAPAIAGDGRGASLLVHTRFLEDGSSHSFRLVSRRLAGL